MKLLLADIRMGKFNIPLPAAIWFLLATIAVSLELSRGSGEINNYLIFKGVFEHSLHQQPLYLNYPAEYHDTNHYGPVFSLLIAPFALLPLYIGCFLWAICNAWVLFYAIQKLQLSKWQQNMILLIAAVEMMTATHNVQFNPMLTGWILLSYTCTVRKQTWLATLLIAAGTLVKLYGIIGLAFFLFTEDKLKFALSFIVWMIILVAAPMIISSPEFVLQSYADWYHSLVEKNASNIDITVPNGMQDISVAGMVRRIFGLDHLPNYIVTVPAGLGCLLPLLRFKQYQRPGFRLTYLAMMLVSVVIYSSSAESPTYVIAVTGVALWMSLQSRPWSPLLRSTLILLFALTILSPTDIVPRNIRQDVVVRYALKALPCFIAWCLMVYQLLRYDFPPEQKPVHE